MSRYLGRVRSAFLAASAAALLAACGPAPQRVATALPNGTTPPPRVSTPAAVPAASPDVAPVLADCDRQMRQQAASDLHTSVAVPFVLTLTPGATTGARVSVFVRHSLAAGLYLAVLDAPVPTRGAPPCPTVAANDVPIASRIAPGHVRRTWYLWAVFPSTITATQPNADVGASAA